MSDKTEYPFRSSWPVEGFPMTESEFVQIRVVQYTHAMPPRKGYPHMEGSQGVYQWYEVRLCFRPYDSINRSINGSYLEKYSKPGRKLKLGNESQCIARFETREEADFFVHKLHQSKSKKIFFNDFANDA